MYSETNKKDKKVKYATVHIWGRRPENTLSKGLSDTVKVLETFRAQCDFAFFADEFRFTRAVLVLASRSVIFVGLARPMATQTIKSDLVWDSNDSPFLDKADF